MGTAVAALQKNHPVAAYRPQRLSEVLDQVSQLQEPEDRLQLILKATQQEIEPTWTSLYWLDQDEQCCFLKLSCQAPNGNRLHQSKSRKVKVSLSDIDSFCQSLSAGQMVSISDAEGSLNAKVPIRLLQQTQARSLLTAPILHKQRLVGFLAVEGNQPRVWEDHEKAYVQAVAQLIGLLEPSVKGELSVSTSSQNLISQFTQWILESKDWAQTLRKVSDQFCRHLQAQRFILLRHDLQTGDFQVDFQYFGPKVRALSENLSPLSEVDLRMMERAIGAIAISDLEDDLRFLAWRESLISQGVRSMMVCRTLADQAVETVLLIANTRARVWQPKDTDCLQQFAQVLGAFDQKNRETQAKNQKLQLLTSASKHLSQLQALTDPNQLINTGVIALQEIFATPLVAALDWQLSTDQATVAAYQSTGSGFSITENHPIQLSQDPLLQRLLKLSREDSSTNLPRLTISTVELPPATRTWLKSPPTGKVTLILLQAHANLEPLAALVIGETDPWPWPEFKSNYLEEFVQTLAIQYRSLQEIQVLKQENTALECLNWYKQRALEFDCQELQAVHQQLHQAIDPCLDHQSNQSRNALAKKQAHPLERLQRAIEAVEFRLQTEDWQLHFSQEVMPLASLFRRSMERIEPLVQQRQLWTQIHNLTANTTLTGTSQKLEMVLHELLLFACMRSQAGNRIDLWCRLINAHWIELSITDQGSIDAQLIKDFQRIDHHDLLTPNSLNQSPGRHLKICCHLVKSLNGRIELAKLEDGRMLSRLSLPLQFNCETNP
ncbi:MAG: GAF domain-containing protein [Acaryochloridaceae cyanobacterium SU_2_1]|nr:GAF domain-containing protein [Acaryochloridaceae cyanobacterium SU_2_1]